MAMKLVVGNLLDDAIVTMTPAADPLFPAEHLADGPGQMGARFGALDADPEVLVDLGGVEGGDGSATGAVAGDAIAVSGAIELAVESNWSIVTSPTPDENAYLAVESDATLGSADHDGNGLSLFIASDEDVAISTLRLTRRAGVEYFMDAWAMKLNESSGQASLRLYSRSTGKYLKADGTWDATAPALVAAGAVDPIDVWFGINAGAGVTFTTESAAELSADHADLELQLRLDNPGAAGTQARFDGIQIVPAVNFMMVAGGHNIPAGLAPVWEASDDGASWTELAVFTVARHQFYAVLDAPALYRFHRLKMTGTPPAKLWMGDLVLGLTQALAREPQEPVTLDYVETGQVRLESPGGSTRISNRGPYPQRRISMHFRFASAAEEAAVRAILVDQVRGGEVSLVVIPGGDFGTLALCGDLENPISVQHSMLGAVQPDPTKREYYSDATFAVREGAGFVLA